MLTVSGSANIFGNSQSDNLLNITGSTECKNLVNITGISYLDEFDNNTTQKVNIKANTNIIGALSLNSQDPDDIDLDSATGSNNNIIIGFNAMKNAVDNNYSTTMFCNKDCLS